MAKEKVTVTIDPAVLADADADATKDGLNRSEYTERLYRDDHYRRLLARATPTPLSADEEALIRRTLQWQNALHGEAA